MGTTLRPLDGARRNRGDRNYGRAWSEVDDAQDDYGVDYGVDYGEDDGGVYADEYSDEYEDLSWPRDRRWRPAIAVVGAVLAIGAVATAVIINSGDSASTKATVGAPAPRTTPSSSLSTSVTPAATRSPDASASPASPAQATPQLPVETFSRVTRPDAAPGVAPPLGGPPAPEAVTPAPPLNPRTVFYTVNGSKQMLDLVNVTYTDARGYSATDFNVSLPWSRVIVLNPEVQSVSVVASSFYARLNCSVVNAAGQTVVASTTNANQATCAR